MNPNILTKIFYFFSHQNTDISYFFLVFSLLNKKKQRIGGIGEFILVTVKELNKIGVTIILTTHYLFEAQEMCNRIAIINKGNLVALDTTKKLLDRIKTKKIIFKGHKGKICHGLRGGYFRSMLSRVRERVPDGGRGVVHNVFIYPVFLPSLSSIIESDRFVSFVYFCTLT